MEVNSALEQSMRKRFSDLFESNKKIESVYKKVRSGTATYEEAHKFAIEVGNILSEVIGTRIDATTLDDDALRVLGNLFNQNTRLVSAVCEGIQQNLNDVAEIGMRPIVPNVGRTKSKVDGIITNFKEELSIEKLIQQNRTLSLSMVDDWVKTNADFQAKAGLSPVIVRVWDGTKGSHDTKRTDWCEQVAGTYEYPVKDKRVFQRHEGCQCVVSYYPNKKAQGKITALSKYEVDEDSALWNTRDETLTTRKANAIKRKQKNGKEHARKIIGERWSNE